MTPKEKASELIDKMYYGVRYDGKENYNPTMTWFRAKQCALIAVGEIQYVLSEMDDTLSHNAIIFYNEVKKEIENL